MKTRPPTPVVSCAGDSTGRGDPLANRATTVANNSWCGSRAANRNCTRRVWRTNTAPIFSRFSRIVLHWARASSVPAQPTRRRVSSTVSAKLLSNRRHWFAHQPWQLVRSANNPNGCFLRLRSGHALAPMLHRTAGAVHCIVACLGRPAEVGHHAMRMAPLVGVRGLRPERREGSPAVPAPRCARHTRSHQTPVAAVGCARTAAPPARAAAAPTPRAVRSWPTRRCHARRAGHTTATAATDRSHDHHARQSSPLATPAAAVSPPTPQPPTPAGPQRCCSAAATPPTTAPRRTRTMAGNNCRYTTNGF